MLGIMAEFVEATERLASIRPAVSIFGSARTPPDMRIYMLTETSRADVRCGLLGDLRRRLPASEAANKGRISASRPASASTSSCRTNKAPIVSGHQPDFPAFFRAQGHVRQVRRGLRRHAGGFGHADELFEALTLVQNRKIAGIPIIHGGLEIWADWPKGCKGR